MTCRFEGVAPRLQFSVGEPLFVGGGFEDAEIGVSSVSFVQGWVFIQGNIGLYSTFLAKLAIRGRVFSFDRIHRWRQFERMLHEH
jgi:hypothetical protein